MNTRVNTNTLSRIGSLFVVICLLSSAAGAVSPKGEKNYKRGLAYEAAQQWEGAAEEFALAVAAEPSNVEYQLHYRRAIFNSSQSFMQQGRTLAEQGDYTGAYNAFRKAYDYDPVNRLALAEMERVLQLRLKSSPSPNGTPTENAPEARIRRANYGPGLSSSITPTKGGAHDAPPPVAPRAEALRVITYDGDLKNFIKLISREIQLNVVFDRDFPKRNVSVDLREVTAAQALDYLFLTEGLFFQKLSRQTILVAEQSKRPQYQQLVLRTFYLYNVDPNDAKVLIQSSIPPQLGRQPVITPNKSTNSITVRDTPENVRLISEILKGIDKERAEVVMDVNIYEVSRTDLLQLGNQIGTDVSLQNLGGIPKGLSILGGSREVLTQGAAALAGPTALGAALLVPASTLSAIQRKDSTRLIASTQVHAFDGEKSTAHIGQRVPVQTAAVAPYGAVSTGDNNNQAGTTQGLFGGNGYPVIQYEKTGLTLEFTPQVFPDLDVQVKMSIKSNDVTQTAGGPALTPTFTERNIEGTARIQNNRTMMIASVAQNQQSRGRQGLPVLGLVPIFGRLFTAPRRSDQQTDIVIAVTPHVMRAPSLTSGDEEMRPSGTLQTPNSDTLEAMIQESSREEQIAAARLIPREADLQLPDGENPGYVPAPGVLLHNSGADSAALVPASAIVVRSARDAAGPAGRVIPEPSPAPQIVTSPGADDSPSAELGRPVEHALEEVRNETATSPAESQTVVGGLEASPRSAAGLRLLSDGQELRVGERAQLKLLLKTDAPLNFITFTSHFDPHVLAVRSVSLGTLAGGAANAALKQMVTPEGLLIIAVMPPDDLMPITGAGVLLVIEVEALSGGASTISLDAEEVRLLATDRRRILLKTTSAQITVKQ